MIFFFILLCSLGAVNARATDFNDELDESSIMDIPASIYTQAKAQARREFLNEIHQRIFSIQSGDEVDNKFRIDQELFMFFHLAFTQNIEDAFDVVSKFMADSQIHQDIKVRLCMLLASYIPLRKKTSLFKDADLLHVGTKIVFMLGLSNVSMEQKLALMFSLSIILLEAPNGSVPENLWGLKDLQKEWQKRTQKIYSDKERETLLLHYNALMFLIYGPANHRNQVEYVNKQAKDPSGDKIAYINSLSYEKALEMLVFAQHATGNNYQKNPLFPFLNIMQLNGVPMREMFSKELQELENLNPELQRNNLIQNKQRTLIQDFDIRLKDHLFRLMKAKNHP